MQHNIEIGSEFHFMPFENGTGLFLPKEGSLVFSGRTAIEAVLKQIPDAKTALLPSYCCDSMIDPFRKAGIKYAFYDVNYDGGLKISVQGKADILLWCNYFGFKTEMPDFGGTIIEDITHSLLSDFPCHDKSSFLVASLRKWMPLYCGGYCSVSVKGYSLPTDSFIKGKCHAMRLKSAYLDDSDISKKQIFLTEFLNTNAWLAENYHGLLIDPFSEEYIKKADIDSQRQKRRKNAHVLYTGLEGKVNFLFPESAMDCPLFVPVVINNRDCVKKQLASKGIFCPSHWPHPNADCNSNLYGAELSLICDQRYSEDDMQRIVAAINDII